MSFKVYSLLYDLYSNLKISSKWLDCIKSILVNSDFDYVWYSQSFYDKELFCRNIIQSLKEMFIQSWRDLLEQSSKCLLYRNIKLNFRCESYIRQLQDTYIYALIKFRCSNHKLQIQLGRRDGPSQVRTTCYQSTMLNWYYLFACGGSKTPTKKKPGPPGWGLVLQVGGCAEG